MAKCGLAKLGYTHPEKGCATIQRCSGLELHMGTKGESEFILEENMRYYSDVYDHVAHLIDSLDTYKDLISSLLDIHINAMNTKLNEVMKVLTVFSTIFMPLTFIVGVYGMNFDFMPELRWTWGYYGVWGVMVVIVVLMILYFKKKKWF